MHEVRLRVCLTMGGMPVATLDEAVAVAAVVLRRRIVVIVVIVHWGVRPIGTVVLHGLQHSVRDAFSVRDDDRLIRVDQRAC